MPDEETYNSRLLEKFVYNAVISKQRNIDVIIGKYEESILLFGAKIYHHTLFLKSGKKRACLHDLCALEGYETQEAKARKEAKEVAGKLLEIGLAPTLQVKNLELNILGMPKLN